MMKRFAKLDPLKMHEIRARELNPIEMKMEWITISDKADAEITRVADTMIDMPIGVAFVDDKGEPGWIGSNPDLKIHYGSLRGCWPTLNAVDKESQ
jgi:hypothetical protein